MVPAGCRDNVHRVIADTMWAVDRRARVRECVGVLILLDPQNDHHSNGGVSFVPGVVVAVPGFVVAAQAE